MTINESKLLSWEEVIQHLRRHGIDLAVLGVPSPAAGMRANADGNVVDLAGTESGAQAGAVDDRGLDELLGGPGKGDDRVTDADCDSWLDSLVDG